MKTKLINIINDLKLVKKETEITVRDEIIFQEAIKIHLTNEIGNQKKAYPYKKPEYKPDKTNISPYTKKEQPATEKQIYVIKKAGKEIPVGLTKKEATRIIGELKNERI